MEWKCGDRERAEMERRRQGEAGRQGQSSQESGVGSQETEKTGGQAGGRSDRRGERGSRETNQKGRRKQIQEGRPNRGQEAPPGPRAVWRPLAPHRPLGTVPLGAPPHHRNPSLRIPPQGQAIGIALRQNFLESRDFVIT